VIDGAEEYRTELGSGRNASDQTNIFPVDGGRRLKLKSRRVHVTDRLQNDTNDTNFNDLE